MKEEIKLDVANYRVKKYKDKYITFCENNEEICNISWQF